MDMSDVAARGLVMLGCGKMGSAMLAGWLRSGLPPTSVYVIDPYPSDWVKAQGVHINVDLPDNPAIAVIAVKPQMMAEALPDVGVLGNGSTLVISVAAGTPIATFESVLGDQTPIVRAMPNTPAMVQRGITVCTSNKRVSQVQRNMVGEVLAAIGEVEWIDDESLMDAVTGVSGSGPAYVFHLTETLAQAGVSQGLPPRLAEKLARATVSGAGELMRQSEATPAELRVNVTSPNGTTQAALEILMAEDGFPLLLRKAVEAATRRSRELAG